jgi:PAS domain S-box-containing protein
MNKITQPKILVIDDEESIRYTFEKFLVKEGYIVTTAGEYDKALALISEKYFDVIFADIILGDRTGIDILREVKKQNMNCPFILITGQPHVGTASEAVRLGAFDYIQKPVVRDTLLHVARLAIQYKNISDEKDAYQRNIEAIFKSVQDAIITVDEQLTILEANNAAETFCGISRDFIGRRFDSLRTGCNAQCLTVLKKTLETKQAFELYRTECRHHSGSVKVITLHASPLLDNKGSFYGAVMVMSDQTRLNDLERDLEERRKFHNIIGESREMQEIYSLIENLADVQTTVLFTGESGTGKELVADALHYHGARRNNPLVKLNCSALSENLLESELFGHVKGAFTGALTDKVGRFQKADTGTIFLDEIGDISQRIQLRLLRILQEGVFERVGDSNSLKTDVRVIAATNQDLGGKIRTGEFREDLYYRLRVFEIDIPPLRKRIADIPLLINHFLTKMNKKFNKKIESVSKDVQEIFLNYSWPGNVRELEHTLEHVFVVCRSNIITVDHLPKNFHDTGSRDDPSGTAVHKPGSDAVLDALRKTGWNKAKAARLIGISRRTMYRKIREYKIQEENEKHVP